MCPSNPDLIAYVFDGDIWVHHVNSDCVDFPQRMTSYASQRERLKCDRSAGYPSFVMQEEFDRYVGFWWQPASRGNDSYSLFASLLCTRIQFEKYINFFFRTP
jgi:dipeptidyl-peptidase 9